MPHNANSNASQPTRPFIGPSPSQPFIGRREARLALTVLLDECCNNAAGAVDITDGQAFDSKRFFANTKHHREIAAMELEKGLCAERGRLWISKASPLYNWHDMENLRYPGLATAGV